MLDEKTFKTFLFTLLQEIFSEELVLPFGTDTTKFEEFVQTTFSAQTVPDTTTETEVSKTELPLEQVEEKEVAKVDLTLEEAEEVITETSVAMSIGE